MDAPDHTGKQFGKLTVICRAEENLSGRPAWICGCECGVVLTIRARALTSGNTKSCGCTRGTHRMTTTPTYFSWKAMWQRCVNPEATDYHRYGGRGVTVCDEWGDFKIFLADMGVKPEGTSLERLDNEKGYSKDNCIWADARTQCRNRDNNRLIEFKGETKTLVEWSESTGIPPDTLGHRLSAGWDVEKALTQKVRSYRAV